MSCLTSGMNCPGSSTAVVGAPLPGMRDEAGCSGVERRRRGPPVGRALAEITMERMMANES